MDPKLELKVKAQELSYKYAIEILANLGYGKNEKYYSLRLYEMQFSIYEQLKLVMNIEDE